MSGPSQMVDRPRTLAQQTFVHTPHAVLTAYGKALHAEIHRRTDMAQLKAMFVKREPCRTYERCKEST